MAIDPTKPWFFAMVDPEETTFGPEHLLQETDEGSLPIFNFVMTHDEGQAPLLELEVLNPFKGLLRPGAKRNAWFSEYDPGLDAVVPRFFGALVGSPSDLQGETIKIQYIARPADYDLQLQNVAESLKRRPNYDPVFLSNDKRDDPSAILEGYSALYHTDRVNGVVSVSDILEGEDGTVVFGQGDAFYDSVSRTLGNAPPASIAVTMDVHWTQQATGGVNFGGGAILTYTGGSLISDWPKPEQKLSGGWTVAPSGAFDVRGVDTAQTFSVSYSYQNHEEHHEFGDTMSFSESISHPVGVTGISMVTKETAQIAYIDQDPDFKDIQPASHSISGTIVALWEVDCELTMRYDASRDRVERLRFVVTADVQQILSATQPQEQITLSGADVGQPLLDILHWEAIAGRSVGFGRVIFTAYPNQILPDSYQMCFIPGTAGTTEPTFSQVVGDETIDGGVTWISLGESLPSAIPGWDANVEETVGTIIKPASEVWAFWTDLVPLPRLIGTAISEGQICKGSNGSYQVCIVAGTTGITEPAFSVTPEATTADGTVTWKSLGMQIPDGATYFVCVDEGVTNSVGVPAFNMVVGSLTVDGGVTWKCLGNIVDFASTPIGDVSRASYFPLDRGLWSLEYGLCVATAHYRQKSRAATVTWQCPLAKVWELSCRKNATLQTYQLPGGGATGKVISYMAEGDGDTGNFVGTVKIGCAIGHGGVSSFDKGDPEYVVGGTIPDRDQFFDGDGNLIPGDGGGIGYSVPIAGVVDDGLVFPLTYKQVVVKDQWHGDIETQTTLINEGLEAARDAGSAEGVQGVALEHTIAGIAKKSVDDAMSSPGAAIWRELEIRPVTGQSFTAEYDIVTTELIIPMQINEEAT